MIKKCKKCGCDALIKNGDWYECPVCGAMMFDVSIFVGNVESPTKELELIDEGKKPTSSYSYNYRYTQTDDSKDEVDTDTVLDSGEYDATPKKKDKSKKPKSKLKEGIQFCTPIVIALIIAVLLKIFVFANIIVPTGSMLNTIQEGDRLVASKLAYINNDPQRYDIVIFRYPDDESQTFVKRIIGMPGETVQVIDGKVYVTDTSGKTSELRDDFVTNCVPDGNFGPYTVALDSYFVMGDNRNDSKDSRYWTNTYVKRDKIIGKVKFRYYPSIGKIE